MDRITLAEPVRLVRAGRFPPFYLMEDAEGRRAFFAGAYAFHGRLIAEGDMARIRHLVTVFAAIDLGAATLALTAGYFGAEWLFFAGMALLIGAVVALPVAGRFMFRRHQAVKGLSPADWLAALAPGPRWMVLTLHWTLAVFFAAAAAELGGIGAAGAIGAFRHEFALDAATSEAFLLALAVIPFLVTMATAISGFLLYSALPGPAGKDPLLRWTEVPERAGADGARVAYPLGTGGDGRVLSGDAEHAKLRRCGNISLAAAGLVLVVVLLPLVMHPLLLVRPSCGGADTACNGVAWQAWTVAMLAAAAMLPALFPAVMIAVPWFSFRRLPVSAPPPTGLAGGRDMLGFGKPLLWAFGMSLRVILAAVVMAFAGLAVTALESGRHAVAPGWTGTVAALTVAAAVTAWWALSRTLPLRLGVPRSGTWANTGRLIAAMTLSMGALVPLNFGPPIYHNGTVQSSACRIGTIQPERCFKKAKLT